VLLLTKGDGKIYKFALGPVGPPPAPTADFTGSPTSDPISLTVDFSNTSTGLYTTCLWDFGDTGSSSECNNPSHPYNTVGTYDVTLTVTGPGGSDTKTEESYIQIIEPPIGAFSATPTEGNTPETVIFTNSSTGVYDTCSWDFSDGGGSSSCSASVSYDYNFGGVFTVSLMVSRTGGSSTETKTGYITMHQASAAASLYLFNGDQPPVLSTSPADGENFTSLFHLKNVTINDSSLTFDSAEAIEAAAAEGKASIEERNIFVNYPVVKWPGGELSVDTEKESYLGTGQLLEAVDTEGMKVTFKLHECFPDSHPTSFVVNCPVPVLAENTFSA
jgi:PKD repeat protein